MAKEKTTAGWETGGLAEGLRWRSGNGGQGWGGQGIWRADELGAGRKEKAENMQS